jgi:phosphoribosylformylglycinamidine synthase
VVRFPVAHGEGRFTGPDDLLDAIEQRGQVAFRYVDAAGRPTAAANPNGSARNIAGIVNERGNVLGMMPHPERAMDDLLGSADGRLLFESLLAAVAA